jgi:hypothetical protein
VTGALTVTPALRTSDGAETALPAVTIQPQEVKAIDIESAIGTSAPQWIGTFGSAVLRYTASAHSALYAVAMVRGLGHSVAFHIDGIGESTDFQAGGREGIWWLPSATASDYLILENQGRNALPVRLTLFDASGKSASQDLTLPPAATNRLSVRQLLKAAGLAGSYGGIQLSVASHAGSLSSLHVVFDENAGFSAILKMFDYDPKAKLAERDYAATRTWTLRAPMLALSAPDPALAFPAGTKLHPQIILRNTTAKTIDASLRFSWRGPAATGKSPGPQLHLLPYETRLIDVAALQDNGTVPKDANWAAVILTSNALPDELVAVAASYDQDLKYGAQTPFSDQLAFHWAGSQWQYDAHHDAVITAGNGGTKPTKAAFTIFYNQGAQKYELEQALQPDEQMWIDVGKLIREHTPDKNGNVLPQDLAFGSYDIRDLTNKGVGTLFEGKIMYDTTYGHVTYGCGVCCGYRTVLFWWDPLDISFLGTSDNGVNAFDTCSNAEDDVSELFYGNWTTANSSIATADFYGTHTGQGVGSTTTSTWGTLQQWKPHSFNCPDTVFHPGGGDNVTPRIDSISPSQGPVGQTTKSVTIKGGGFGTNPTVNAGSNITVTITSKTDTQIVADFAVSGSAAIGAQPVTVTVMGAPTSNSVNFGVAPRIDSISPSRGLIGATTTSVTITGLGLSGAHVNTPATIQVQNITTATNTQITFDAVVSNSATPGNNPAAISVTASGETSTAFDFFVQVPTNLSIVPGSVSGTTEQQYTNNCCGTIVSFRYQVNDQQSQPIRAAMSFYDTFGSFSPDNLQLQGTPLSTTCPNNTGPCNVFTVSDGTFTEAALGGCSTVCFVGGKCTTGGPSGVPQTWHIAGYAILQQVSEFCEKVLINGTQVQ